MTHRERVQAAVRGEVPDRQPVDLGSTLASTMTISAQERLRDHLGLLSAEPAVLSKRSQTVVPDEAILRRFDVDCRPLLLGAPELRPDRPAADGDGFTDEWGITWQRPHDGHFINTGGPFYDLDEPALGDLDRFDAPAPADPGRYRELARRARALHEETDFAVVLTLGVGPVHQAQFLRGYARWLEDTLVNPAFAEGLLELYVDFFAAVAERALTAAADFVDIVMFGDDVGTQKSTLIRPEQYRRLIKPYHRRVVDVIKRFGKPVLYHTCGSVSPLIPDFIEIGVDILNPVQVSAAHMDAGRLNSEFGRDICFWGGVDSQHVLPAGSADEVRSEVMRRRSELGPAGYVLAAAHNIQGDVPPANVVAMFEAAVAP